jgi:hypothetical protein
MLTLMHSLDRRGEEGTEQNMSDTEKEKSAERWASTDRQERTEEHDRVKSSAMDS